MAGQGQKEPLKGNTGVQLTNLKINEPGPPQHTGSMASHDSDSDESTDGRDSLKRFQRVSRRMIKDTRFQILMVFCFMFALFGHDLFNVLDIPDAWNFILDGGMCFVTFVFAAEMVLYWFGDYFEYAFTLLFIVDVISIISMTFEVSFLFGTAGHRETMGDGNSVRLARATRAAKVGARAFRFLKLLKLLNILQRRQRQDSVSMSELQRMAISQNLKSTLGNKIAVLAIVMVIVLPFIEVEQWLDPDMSVEVWCERIEFNYQRAYNKMKDNPDLLTADDLEKTIRGMNRFYEMGATRPFEVVGLPEKVQIDEVERTIPGASILKEELKVFPSRAEFVRVFALKGRHNANWHKKVFLLVDNEKVCKLRGLENFIMVSFVLIVVLWSSNDLRKSLEPLLDAEKQAEFAKLLLKNNVVDESELQGMSLEDKGVIQELMDLGPKKKRTFKARESSFAIHEKVVIVLPLEEDVINSYGVNCLDLDQDKLYQLMLYIFFDSELSRHSGRIYTEVQQFARFYETVKSKYNDVPYHSVIHACDVTYTTFRVLCEVRSLKWATDIEHYAMLLSAVCHDVGHPGTTNAFCVETEHEFALRYNDASPLENMHCATMFEICRDPELNMFAKLKPQDKKEARKICIKVILHTDLMHHFQMVKDLELIYGDETSKKVLDEQAKSPFQFSKEFEDVLQEHHLLFLELILHQSDISNPLKPFETGKAWAWKVMDEFFAQGDREKELGIPVGMLNDRDKTNPYGSQHGFITFLVSPLVLGATNIFQTMLPLCENMAINLWEWHRQWCDNANPPAADVDKRVIEVNKIEEKVKALCKRGADGRYKGGAARFKTGRLSTGSRSRYSQVSNDSGRTVRMESP